ncbi:MULTISPECIES: transcriptional regulator SdiA [Buttiauxella]|uniref:transcriptional regulator SdiA n=1 Tax=Buttiauxella TaxID=82976 RepID=UPI00155FFED5|nr:MULTISPECIES: transcriptional regulator SdiA [Buttiauxella]MCS3601408.1 LuxR family transcriptional regulator [Buttiauxella sp. BIGb0471]BCG08979.1 transcriptional regulator SdiA [Buttiauxella agrestis]
MDDHNFFRWRQDVLNIFQSVTEADEITKILHQQTELMEFDYFSLCIRHPVPFTRPKTSLRSSYPQSWLDHYHAANYFAIDPVLRPENFMRGNLPWDDALFGDTQEFWDAARDHGLRRGISQCVMSPNRALGFLSVSRTANKGKILADDLLQMRLQYLGELSLMTLTRLNDSTMDAVTLKLSKREREILQWTGEGKTSAEIAIILSISENTVNFHQKNMQKKFNAPNKTQIACYAAAIGII